MAQPPQQLRAVAEQGRVILQRPIGRLHAAGGGFDEGHPDIRADRNAEDERQEERVARRQRQRELAGRLRHEPFGAAVQEVVPRAAHRIELQHHGGSDQQHEVERQHAGHIEPDRRRVDGRINRIRQRREPVDGRDRSRQAEVPDRIHEDKRRSRQHGRQQERGLNRPPRGERRGAVQPGGLRERIDLPFHGGIDAEVGKRELAERHDRDQARGTEDEGADPVRAEQRERKPLRRGEHDPALRQNERGRDEQHPDRGVQQPCGRERLGGANDGKQAAERRRQQRRAGRQQDRVLERFLPERPFRDFQQNMPVAEFQAAEKDARKQHLNDDCPERTQHENEQQQHYRPSETAVGRAACHYFTDWSENHCLISAS